QVRNHGTVGGSLAHADPASDFAAVAVATDARLRLVSASGVREVAASDFFAGPFSTALERGELIAEIVLAADADGSAYVSCEGASMTGLSGAPLARLDAGPKVRGATRYAADLDVPGLLHARLVPALEAHARLLGIDAEAALAVPGVVAVLTAGDLPIRAEGDSRAVEPLARDEIVFAGQPVAVVVAETEAAAEDGAELVMVTAE